MPQLLRSDEVSGLECIIVSWNLDSSSSSGTNLFHSPEMAQSLSPSLVLITLLYQWCCCCYQLLQSQIHLKKTHDNGGGRSKNDSWKSMLQPNALHWKSKSEDCKLIPLLNCTDHQMVVDTFLSGKFHILNPNERRQLVLDWSSTDQFENWRPHTHSEILIRHLRFVCYFSYIPHSCHMIFHTFM